MSHAPPPNLSALPAIFPFRKTTAAPRISSACDFPISRCRRRRGVWSICRTFLAAPFFIFIR